MRSGSGATGRGRWKPYWPVFLLAISALGVAVLDGDSGVRTWLARRAELKRSDERNEILRRENSALRAEARALEADPFRVEKAIREDLGLAMPGEVVVLLRSHRDSDVPLGAEPYDAAIELDERDSEPEVFEKR